MYLVIISVAITLSFHFKTAPTEMEKKMALPLGMIFWTLSLLTLVTGLANYCGTIEKYRRQKALVQSGIITNIVSALVIMLLLFKSD